VLAHNPFEVFIAYESDVAADWAGSLKHALEKRGVHSFFDKEDIPKGSLDYQADIDNALSEVNVFLLIWSSPGLSGEVIGEMFKALRRARKEGKPTIVIFMMVGLQRSYPNVNEALGIDTKKLQQIDFEPTKESLARNVILFLNNNRHLIGGKTLSDRVEV
jgi:hypothetical protein